jgi:hypothetical protein
VVRLFFICLQNEQKELNFESEGGSNMHVPTLAECLKVWSLGAGIAVLSGIVTAFCIESFRKEFAMRWFVGRPWYAIILGPKPKI